MYASLTGKSAEKGLSEKTAKVPTNPVLLELKTKIIDKCMIVRQKHKGGDDGRLAFTWCDFTNDLAPFGIVCESSDIDHNEEECLRVDKSYSLKKPITFNKKRHADMCDGCFRGALRLLDVDYSFE